MEDLLKQAQDLVKSLQEKIASVNDQKKKQDNTAIAQEQKGIELVNASGDLAKREAAIKEMESVSVLKAQIKEQQNKNADELLKLDNVRNKIKTEQEDIIAQRQDIARERELIAKEYALIKKANEQLKIDREKYKDDVLKKLKNTGV